MRFEKDLASETGRQRIVSVEGVRAWRWRVSMLSCAVDDTVDVVDDSMI